MRRIQQIVLAAALCGGAAAARAVAPPLRLCADPANLPFSSNAPEAAANPGLYVEIGQAVAAALGRPLQTVWSLSYFGKRNLRSTMLAGQCDMAVGLPAEPGFMGPALIFSRPILRLGYALVLPRGVTAAGQDTLERLKGRRVAVQFASPPQSLLAARGDITAVTVMEPEEGMRQLAAGQVDAAFVWGPSAGWFNHALLQDRFDVVPYEAAQMQFPAAIGFAKRDGALRDEVDAALVALAPRLRELGVKYALADTAPASVSDAGPGGAAPVAQADKADKVDKGNPSAGKEVFNGTCAHCHGPNAVVEDRKINLRRLQLKYGEQLNDTFFTTVTEGRPSKGMPSWKEVFKHQDFVDILAYLKTVQEK
jgi:ABC-type amino acid transport substrate-binding protein/cytochrome c553